MSWSFVAGVACGAILFDALWRFTFHKWMKLHDRQQEHMKLLGDHLFKDDE